MTISISPDNEKFIQEAVRKGEYSDPTAIMNEALRLLRQREELRRAVHAGLDQLDQGMRIDGEQVFAEIQRHLNEKKQG